MMGGMKSQIGDTKVKTRKQDSITGDDRPTGLGSKGYILTCSLFSLCFSCFFMESPYLLCPNGLEVL